MSHTLEVDRPATPGTSLDLGSGDDVVEPGRFSPPTDFEVRNDFDYKPVPVLAPVAAVLGVCSLTALWAMPAMGVALIGVVVGAVAVRKIAASDGELGGMMLAAAGLGLSLALFVGGTGLHAYTIATEVPEGFRRVNFAHEISAYEISMDRGQYAVAPPVFELTEEPIFTKGYMFPSMETKNLTAFLLVKDNQLCCFGKQVDPTDMILVELPEGQTFDYTTSMVSVGGNFRVEPARRDDQSNAVVYRMDAKIVERSKTVF
jgi:hypothetical protein